jgi:hypothetical protein
MWKQRSPRLAADRAGKHTDHPGVNVDDVGDIESSKHLLHLNGGCRRVKNDGAAARGMTGA